MMSFFAWLEKGMPLLAAAGVGCVYLGSISFHTWGVSMYRDIYQIYDTANKRPARVDPESLRISEEILDKMTLDGGSRPRARFYMTVGQDVQGKGATNWGTGAFIGIPKNFCYKNSSDVEMEKITLNNQPILWDSEAGIDLLRSLIVSQKAKRYAIAHQIAMSSSTNVQLHAVHLSTCLALTYGAGYIFNRRLGNVSRKVPLLARILVSGFFCCLGAILYCFTQDNLNWWCEGNADKRVISLGQEYVEGGIEYYSQLLKRNVALRDLMGPDGSKLYTAYGNLAHTWRSPHIPLTTRKDRLKAALRNFQTEDAVKS